MNGNENLRSEEKEFIRSNSLDYVAERWHSLPPHIREAIVTLVDAAKATALCNNSQNPLSQDTTSCEA